MTNASIAFDTLIILALLGALVTVLGYIHKSVMPAVKDLAADFASFKSETTTKVELNAQQTDQNTKRLDRQGLKLAAIPTPISPTLQMSSQQLLEGIAAKAEQEKADAAPPTPLTPYTSSPNAVSGAAAVVGHSQE